MSESDQPTDAQEILEESQKLKHADDDEGEKKTRDVIFVGIKPIMTYVTATLTQLSNQPFVTIKARGQRITQAVDVSQRSEEHTSELQSH